MEETKQQQVDEQVTQTEEPKQDKGPEMISRAEFDKVLNDMHKFKNAARDYEQRLEQKDMDSLREKEDYKKLAETYESKYREADEQVKTLKSSFMDDRKYAAIREEAIKQGIRQEAIDDLDLQSFDSVMLETTSTGRMNVLGVDVAVKDLKARKPHWFGKATPVVNTSSPEVKFSSGGDITPQDILKAQAKAQKTKSQSDLATYQQMVKKYQLQKRGN